MQFLWIWAQVRCLWRSSSSAPLSFADTWRAKWRQDGEVGSNEKHNGRVVHPPQAIEFVKVTSVSVSKKNSGCWNPWTSLSSLVTLFGGRHYILQMAQVNSEDSHLAWAQKMDDTDTPQTKRCRLDMMTGYGSAHVSQFCTQYWMYNVYTVYIYISKYTQHTHLYIINNMYIYTHIQTHLNSRVFVFPDVRQSSVVWKGIDLASANKEFLNWLKFLDNQRSMKKFSRHLFFIDDCLIIFFYIASGATEFVAPCGWGLFW